MYTTAISAVYVEQLNVFEGQYHLNTDDNTWRFWDDGLKTMYAYDCMGSCFTIAWEGHDEGDVNPNAASSSFAVFGDITWMSADDVAQFFNKSSDDFTPEKFKPVYKDMWMWIREHEYEAATSSPNPLPELELIEQVKDETNSADKTNAPADAANPAADDSGSGRQLASVAARFVSAALRVGI